MKDDLKGKSLTSTSINNPLTNTIVDTNILLDYPDIILDKSICPVLPITVIEELDGLKTKDYRARKALRTLLDSSVRFISKDSYKMPEGWDPSKNDNKIIMCAKENNFRVLSNDIAVLVKCKEVGVDASEYQEAPYTGVITIEGSTEEILEKYSAVQPIENQYVITTNTDTDEVTESVYRDGFLYPLSLPPSKVIKGWNSYQRCALDLLLSEAPIKIIAGTAGSGKTKLAVEIGNYLLERRKYGKMLLIRNPIGPGEDIGFLRGSFEEKTDHFFMPLINNLGEEVVSDMLDRGQLEKQIPYFAKGLTFKDSFVIVDEAEDLNLKTLKLIGSRVGKGSSIVLSGDFAQAENKFVSNNGLSRLIQEAKGNPLIGIVVLQEDVRSPASKLFTEL